MENTILLITSDNEELEVPPEALEKYDFLETSSLKKEQNKIFLPVPYSSGLEWILTLLETPEKFQLKSRSNLEEILQVNQTLKSKKVEVFAKQKQNEWTQSKHKLFSLEEVKKHNDPSSCWLVVGNLIFDVTTWLDEHPGGAEIILDTNKGQDALFLMEIYHEPATFNMMHKYFIGCLDPNDYSQLLPPESPPSESFLEMFKEKTKELLE